MKILFVNYRYLGYGGAEISALNLARELSMMGHEVVFASTKEYEGFKTYLFKVMKFPFFQLYNKYLENFLSGIIKEDGFDVVHTHHRMTTVAAIKAAKKNKVPVVAHFRDYWFCCPRSSCLAPDYTKYDVCSYRVILGKYPKKRLLFDLYKWFTLKRYWKTLEKADAKIAVSSLTKDKLELCGIRTNVHIVNNSRDISKLSNVKNGKFRKKYNLKEIVVLFDGNFTYTKGPMNLLKIIPNIVKKHKNVSFIFISDGVMRPIMEDFVKLKQIEDYVVFTGRIDLGQVPVVHADSDIFVFPTLWDEPFAGCLIEAMGSGTPIIASNSGGNREAVVEGKNGFLIDPNNAEEFTEKLELLIKDKMLRAKMGRFGREYVKNFSNEATAKKIEKIYSALK